MKIWGVLLAASGRRAAAVTAGLACLLAACPVWAQGSRYDAAVFEPDHRPQLRIPPGGPYPVVRKATIGLDKSMLVEVPIDLQNVLVSNPEVVDAVVQSSRQVYLLAKTVGEANAFFIGPDGQKVLFLELTVNRDLSALQDALNRLLPGAKVRAEAMGDNVVLAGSVASPVDANRAAELAAKYIKKKDGVINMLSTDSKEQVLLKVHVAEMQRDAIRRIGVDMPSAVKTTGDVVFSKAFFNGFPVTSQLVPKATAIAPGVAPAVAAGTALLGHYSDNGESLTAIVQALERTGVARMLAEPTLTALSGESAKFLAGGEFPVPVSQEDNKVSVEWKEFGVNVNFKPVVLSEGRISLSVAAEVSELTTEGAVTVGPLTLSGLKVRRAETTLELPSGGTLAMAGLLSEDTRQGVEGLPVMKNLPILGALFRSNDYRRRETELVILVTPFVATHSTAAELTKPTDGFMPQTDIKELFFGHINRVYGGPGAPGSLRRFFGDYGYMIEYPGVKG
jgi:pilus assembly protein CpaC